MEDLNTTPTVRDRLLQRQREQREQFYADAAPGTPEAVEAGQRQSTETTFSLLKRGFHGTAAYGVYRYVGDEWGHQDDPNFRAADHFEELTKGIPVQFHEAVMAAGSLEEAQRIRARVQEDLTDQSILAGEGRAGTLAMIAGSIFDVDAPLMFLSGGAYQAAKVGRLASIASGAKEGIKAGFVVGAVDASVRETVDWADVPAAVLTNMAFGAGVGAAYPKRFSQAVLEERSQLIERVANDPTLGRVPDYTATDHTPTLKPLVIEYGGDTPTFSTSPLRDVIAGGESTGNYNAYFGNAGNTEIDFSTMSVDQVLDWQADFKRTSGQPHAPVGRYQIVPSTLRRLKEDLGLTGTEKFTPELQDRLADALLDGRGYQDFRAGKITEDQFLDNLSKEWAALQNSQGKANYDHGGTVPVDEIRQALRSRAANDNQSPTGPAEAVGASRNTDRPSLTGENVSDTSLDWIDGARNWREDTGWLDAKKAERNDEGWFSRHFRNIIDKASDFNLPVGDFHRLYKSESAVANWLAGAMLESPLGLARGRQTAAMRMEAYQSRIMSRMAEPYTVQMQAWANSNGQSFLGGRYTPEAARKEFNKLVQLELNRRRLTGGQPGQGVDPSVSRAADAIEGAADEAYGILKGRDGETSVDGFEEVEKKAGYSPQVWSSPAIQRLTRAHPDNKRKIVAALAQGYVRAGVDADIADKIARSVINRSLAKADGFDTSLANLLTKDGREFLVEQLVKDGVEIEDASKIADRLRAPVEERSKESFTKRRTDLDLSVAIQGIPGEANLKLVDLLDNDMMMTWSRYARRSAGSAALARMGITNRAQRYDIIEAMQKEQAALGEAPIDPKFVEDVFSHFDGGPIAGGVSPAVAAVKRATNLAYLGMLGATQLGELGAQIGVVGVRNWIKRTPEVRRIFDGLKEEAQSGTKGGVLDELSVYLGDIGREHNLFRDDLAVDEVGLPQKEQSALAKHIQNGLAKGQRMQGYISAFYHVRAAQQRMAVASMADKAIQEIATDGGQSFRKRLNDIGLQQKDIEHIADMVEQGVIEFQANGYTVNRLNLDQWDPDVAENFALSLNRHQNQVVQKAMAGEDNAWMHRDTGSLLTHLISFPLLAIQKQTGRQARLMDAQALSSLGLTFATAVLAYQVRNAASGDISKMDDVEEMAKYGFSMGNMTGFIPMFTDPLATMAGLEDYRFNQYGPHTQKSIPALDWANDALRIPGALKDYAIGEDNGFDRQAVKALPYANTAVARLTFD